MSNETMTLTEMQAILPELAAKGQGITLLAGDRSIKLEMHEYEALSEETRASLARAFEDVKAGRVGPMLDANGKPIDFSMYLDEEEKRLLEI